MKMVTGQSDFRALEAEIAGLLKEVAA